MKLTPKQQFLKTRDAKVHADLVLSPPFVNAINFALLEYVNQQPTTKDQYLDACAMNRIAGARQFADVLINLAEPRTIKTTKETSNLDHNL